MLIRFIIKQIMCKDTQISKLQELHYNTTPFTLHLTQKSQSISFKKMSDFYFSLFLDLIISFNYDPT